MDISSRWTYVVEREQADIGKNDQCSLKSLILPRIGMKAEYCFYELCGNEIFLAKPSAVFSEDMMWRRPSKAVRLS